jgi:hypothetical protein
MPDKANNAKQDDAFEAIYQYYKEAYKMAPKDALEMATETYKRGLSSPIYQEHLKQAQKYAADKTRLEGDYPETNMADPTQLDPNAFAQQSVLDTRRAKLAQLAPRAATLQEIPPAPSDPQAAAAQQTLDARRQALVAPAVPTKTVQLNEIDPGQLPPEFLTDPAAYQAQEALNARRAAVQSAAPVSPAPILAAAPTPEHLEDANLSSWQSLANLLTRRK